MTSRTAATKASTTSISLDGNNGGIAAPVSETEDVGVLRDVLDELDRERSQRAELEAKVRELQTETLRNVRAKRDLPTTVVSQKDWIALKTEKEGLVELLNALLGKEPPFDASSNLSSLPPHAIRLLEIMPWDPRARQHAIDTEALFEWQFYLKDRWVQNLRHFPPRFRNLPVIEPKPGQEQQLEVTKKGLFGVDMKTPPKNILLTNAETTHVVNIDKGYPLPEDDATWDWAAGWRVDRHVAVLDKQGRAIDCDDQGWSYAKDPLDFGTRELCWDHATDEKGVVVRRYRRRKWTRPRVLVSYPNASQRTLEYLRLLGENMRLRVSVTKLSDQLVETKTALTMSEAKILEIKEESAAELGRMKTKLRETEELFNELELGVNREDVQNMDVSFKAKLVHVENLGKEHADKMHKLWRSPSWKADGGSTGDKDDGEQRFDWKSISSGGLIEHIKRSPGLLPHRRKSLLDDTMTLPDGQSSSSNGRESQEQPLLLQPNELAGRDRKGTSRIA